MKLYRYVIIIICYNNSYQDGDNHDRIVEISASSSSSYWNPSAYEVIQNGQIHSSNKAEPYYVNVRDYEYCTNAIFSTSASTINKSQPRGVTSPSSGIEIQALNTKVPASSIVNATATARKQDGIDHSFAENIHSLSARVMELHVYETIDDDDPLFTSSQHPQGHHDYQHERCTDNVIMMVTIVVIIVLVNRD